MICEKQKKSISQGICEIRDKMLCTKTLKCIKSRVNPATRASAMMNATGNRIQPRQDKKIFPRALAHIPIANAANGPRIKRTRLMMEADFLVSTTSASPSTSGATSFKYKSPG